MAGKRYGALPQRRDSFAVMDSARFLLYSRAYATLGRVTPIPADCGRLCGAKCCSGDDNAGMILFPGEAEFIANADFLNISKSKMHGTDIDFASCSGTCKRQLRPLSCRIFPLAPFWDGEELKVAPDPRAKYLCPLLGAEEFISPDFYSAVFDAFSILVSDPEISDMLRHYTGMLEEYSVFSK